MYCAKCNSKGYITSSFSAKNSLTRMCDSCKNIAAYSKYVAEKYKAAEKTENIPQLVHNVPISGGEPLYLYTPDGCKLYNLQAYRKLSQKR